LFYSLDTARGRLAGGAEAYTVNMSDNHQAAIAAIQTGDVDGLKNLLRQDPSLATARPDGTRTLLHVATDWPGHFPNNVATVIALIESGADVNAPSKGRHSETPLHWAASSDDVAVLDTLLDHGADIEATGAVIGGGTPLADAVAFGQWNAARRLVERGARANLWQAAGLGMMARVHEFFISPDRPSADEVTNAFWCACAGGQRETAEYLLERGADLNWVGYNGRTPIDAAQRSNAGDLVEWLRGLGAETSSA
jgi:ankyrin repeat protein